MTEREFYSTLQDTKEGREYLELVSSCTSRALVPEPGFEIHHIFLTSLGGQNVPENKVKFTVFEHCRAHALIAKAIPCYKTLQPITYMSQGQVQKLSDLEKVTLEEQLEWSKLREKALHQPKSPEHVAKMRATMKGRKLSAEVRSHMGGAGRGKKFINNGTIHKRVLPEDLDYWLSQGWVLGRTKALVSKIADKKRGQPSSEQGKRCITKDGREKKVLPEELERYIQDGWIEGRCQTFSEKRSRYLKGNTQTKGRKRIHNSEGKELLVTEAQLEKYLSKGWVRGTSEQHLANIKRVKDAKQ